jgi:hypothetical protein
MVTNLNTSKLPPGLEAVVVVDALVAIFSWSKIREVHDI